MGNNGQTTAALDGFSKALTDSVIPLDKKIVRLIKWVDKKYPHATERQKYELVSERYVQ